MENLFLLKSMFIMINKVKPFIRRSIKDNVFFIFGNIFIFILIIVTVKIGLTESINYDKKISDLKAELKTLQIKVNLMNTVIPSSDKLDDDLNFLNSMIPNAEDYFSIIYALDKLSQKSNFIITEYIVNTTSSSTGGLQLEVTGSGDSESFINFLKEYNFGGNRLITAGDIHIDPNFLGSISIDLTFYSKSTPQSENLDQITSYKFFEDLEKIKAKINFIFDNNKDNSEPDFNYPKKTNPF